MMSQWVYLRNTGRSPLLLLFCFYFLLYLEVDSINQFNRRKIYVLSNNAVTCDGFDFYSSFTDFDVNKYKSDFIPYCHCIIGICIQNFRYNVQTYALILLYINIHVCFCLYYVNISFLLPLHMEVYFGDGVVWGPNDRCLHLDRNHPDMIRSNKTRGSSSKIIFLFTKLVFVLWRSYLFLRMGVEITVSFHNLVSTTNSCLLIKQRPR